MPRTSRPPFDEQTGLHAIDAPTGIGRAPLHSRETLTHLSAQPARPGDEATRLGPSIGSTPAAPGAGASHDGPLAIGQSFGTRYHIIRLLGIGGMGAVYQAWDAELGVAVAIKVIRPEVTADPDTAAEVERRFKRELVLARQVTHKNVVRIHDLGEIDGIKYITMPYVEGADLATVLREQGRLPVDKTLRIIRSVVSGLVAAHSASVVHRDLKPANIMIDAGDDALIMDFGIARSTGAPVGVTVPGMTTIAGNLKLAMAQPDATLLGAVVGTVAYMAPEQARGVAVDQRADIYALGLILYDMLAGARTSGGNNPVAELQARMEHAPPAIKSIVPEVPEPLSALVSRCLEPDPAKRFQTTAELSAELDRLDARGELIPIRRVFGLRVLAALATLLVVLIASTWYFARRPVAPVKHEPVSVLIADFDNQTNEPAFNGALERALGIAVEGASFITSYDRQDAHRALAQIKPGATLDEASARLVATREGIKVILAGAIARRGEGYAITLKGVNPDDGKALWTETATAQDRDHVLAALGSVAVAVRGDVGDTAPLSAQRAEAESVTASSLEALQAYSQAQDAHLAGKDEDAVRLYQQAIDRDPQFGRAYAGYATAAYHLGRKDQAAELWKKALTLMDRMTEREKYRTLGTYYFAVAGNYDQAIDNYEKLVQLYPTDLAGHNNLAYAYFNVLNFPKALEEGRKALDIYPRKMLFRNNYVLYAMYASDFATAATGAAALVKDEPGFAKNYLPVAIAAIVNGQFDAARNAYEQMSRTGDEGASLAAMGLADLALYRGQYPEAEHLLKAGIAQDQRARNSAGIASKQIALAETYEAMGRTPAALTAVKAALAEGRQESILVPAARLYLRAGLTSEASKLAAELDNRLQTQTRAYAKIIDGNVALANNRAASAIESFRDATKLADFWMAHFDIGVTYAQAGQAHAAEALGELEACQKRRGEATAIFLDDTPSVRYLATLSYWLGRAQEGVGQEAAARENFKTFLAIRGDSKTDPLVRDARKRAGS